MYVPTCMYYEASIIAWRACLILFHSLMALGIFGHCGALNIIPLFHIIEL